MSPAELAALLTKYTTVLALCAAFLFSQQTLGFDPRTDTNGLAVYWGQNTLSVQTDGAQNERPLSQYCADANAPDIVMLSFHNVFTKTPQLNLANHCETRFRGSQMLNCQPMADQIKACQKKGIRVVLSMGGASGAYSMDSDADGASYAQTVYDTYLGGKGSSDIKRPFGDAVLDGVDLDIEGGGSSGYASFTNKLHEISPDTLITSAPQCPFPDAYLANALDNGWFDAVFVQFYNNACSPDNADQFNFGAWADWASTKSKNANVKVYIGTPACKECASSGFLGAEKISQVYKSTKSKYKNVLGGVMLWDAGSAYYGSSPIAASLRNGPLKS
ncbi:Chitinase 2 [Coemansia sp. Benny D160-2]|nr:Chitinase 2 [Coemansia sp. Benny D160-2]